jgi:hypothetical protein
MGEHERNLHWKYTMEHDVTQNGKRKITRHGILNQEHRDNVLKQIGRYKNTPPEGAETHPNRKSRPRGRPKKEVSERPGFELDELWVCLRRVRK